MHRIKENGFILQQHTKWSDRKKDFLILHVAGHEAYAFFLGVERAFCLGCLDMHPYLPLLIGLGVFLA